MSKIMVMFFAATAALGVSVTSPAMADLNACNDCLQSFEKPNSIPPDAGCNYRQVTFTAQGPFGIVGTGHPYTYESDLSNACVSVSNVKAFYEQLCKDWVGIGSCVAQVSTPYVDLPCGSYVHNNHNIIGGSDAAAMLVCGFKTP